MRNSENIQNIVL